MGCGRSGTSIFGELFERLPGYHYYSEPVFDEVLRLETKSSIAIKVPRESDLYPGEPGLSFPLALMQSLLPDAVYFWQVRHPFDAIASLRPGIANNWGHHPRPPDWQAWLTAPLIERCAHHWQFINEFGYAQVRDVALVCTFESMIRDPHRFARRAASAATVDVAMCTPVLDRWAKTVQNTNNEQFVEARTSRNLSRPDHVVKVGRYRENFDATELARILPIVKATAMNFGYQLDS